MVRRRTDVDVGPAILKVEDLRERLRENPILRSIGEALKEWMDKNFRTQGGISLARSSWDPIAVSTQRKDDWIAPLVRTGELKESSFFEVSGGKVEAGYSDNKASYHHFGTRPHKITAKRAEFLQFPDKIGDMVFTKSVNHPGTPKRHLLPTNSEVSKIAIREVRSRVREGLEDA